MKLSSLPIYCIYMILYSEKEIMETILLTIIFKKHLGINLTKEMK